MLLKEFKTGIEYLARATNQREKEPDPFVVQVGKDGRVSLVSGNEHGTYVWRTPWQSDMPGRYPIASKSLVQGAKTLKGKVELELEVTVTELVVRNSTGGTIAIPFQREMPELIRPPQGEAIGYTIVPEGRIDQLSRAVEAANTSRYYDVTTFIPEDRYARFVSTDRYIYFHTFIGVAFLDRPFGLAAPFWNGLRGATTNGELRFHESGLHVRAGQFEAFTSRLQYEPDIVDYKAKYFPEGEAADVRFLVDRKVILGSIKSVADTKQSIRFEVGDEGYLSVTGIETTTSVGIPTSRLLGDKGKVECMAGNIIRVLDAIDSPEVGIGFNNFNNEANARPLIVKPTDRSVDSFLLAPIFRG